MARLIDADKAKFFIADVLDIFKVPIGDKMASRLIDTIDKLPTVDAVEVVHGRWEDFCRGKMCRCSACKAEFDNTCNEIHGEWKFCPHCGAKMNLKGE
jgi:hypothetical protein